MSPTPELTARARILHAAVRRFATDGLHAGLRTVASDAGVTAGLIIYHFGSRDGLLSACDQEVLALTRSSKTAVMTGGAGEMLTQLAQAEQYAPAVGYVLRRLQAGGPMATQLVEDFVADSVSYLAEGEKAGVIRPSRDPEARARLLTEMALGALLLQMPAQKEHLDVEELPRWMGEYSARIIAPYLELFTEPLLTDSSMLEAYRAQGTDPQETP
ncbi:TetR family transcriptional regulator [Brachybacterium muris]|uniref:TetR/AcrR family transcriptional regulator n=1 Tax=Brachybacterium muris TaxID=219301 RepID=UPI00223BE53D|nr:TetR family transcriptional regulator [Brachybacterium muris]MCT2261364.1 TetR family transcriptional regulator [Brachybacterium muris]